MPQSVDDLYARSADRRNDASDDAHRQGASSLQVVTNGIASTAVAVTIN